MLIDWIRSDLSRLEKPSIRSFLKWYFFPRGRTFRFQVWFRIMQTVKRKRLLRFLFGGIVYFIFRHYEYKYGIHINSNIEVGKGMLIAHGDAVYINVQKIGDYFTVYQAVTLGADEPENIPLIMDCVTVYTGAVVIGNIVLNSHSTIGANAFVNRDVKAYDVVAGIPAISIKKL